MAKKQRRRSSHAEFSTDRPITSSRADRLGRKSFAQGLAQRIRAWNGRDSLVIALCGEWGCGKTSLKNLILEELNRGAGRKIDLVEFNPWEISGHASVSEALFRELFVVLNENEHDPAATEKRVNKLRAYAKLAALGGSAAKWLGKALNVGGHEFGPAIEMAGSAAEIAGTAMEGTGETVEQSADAYEARGKNKEQSLSELKRSLAMDMADLEQPVLIVIDDIDRLTTDEIREVFQLVKANGDFPNLIYLLMFDRDIVSGALDTVSGGRGMEFLDKIVQVLFHVPQPPLSDVRQVLFDGLNVFLAEAAVAERWESDRWNRIWWDGLVAYFTNLRSVYRFLGSFGFQVSQMQNERAFELNPIDLVALETLRLFESKFYESIPGNRSLFIGGHVSLFTQDDPAAKQTRVDELERLLTSTVPESRRARVRELLTHLFPALFGHRHSDDESMLRGLRVGQETIFQRYFTLRIPKDDIAQGDLDTLRRNLADPRNFTQACLALKKRGLLDAAFERLDAYKEHLPTTLFPGMITALSDVGDFLPKSDQAEFAKFDALTHAWRLIYFCLRRVEDGSQRFEWLQSGFSASQGVRLLVLVASRQERRPDGDAHSYLIDEVQALELTRLATERLRLAAEDGRLRALPGLKYVLYRWSEWTTPEEVRSWIMSGLNGPTDALWVLRTFLSVMRSESHKVQFTRYIVLSALEPFVDLGALEPWSGRLLRLTSTRCH